MQIELHYIRQINPEPILSKRQARVQNVMHVVMKSVYRLFAWL